MLQVSSTVKIEIEAGLNTVRHANGTLQMDGSVNVGIDVSDSAIDAQNDGLEVLRQLLLRSYGGNAMIDERQLEKLIAFGTIIKQTLVSDIATILINLAFENEHGQIIPSIALFIHEQMSDKASGVDKRVFESIERGCDMLEIIKDILDSVLSGDSETITISDKEQQELWAKIAMTNPEDRLALIEELRREQTDTAGR